MPIALAMDELPIAFDEQTLLQLCEKYRIAELSFFGSVTRDDFNPARSDVDVLVEFLPDTPVRALFMSEYSWYAIRKDFKELFHRKVDLIGKESLDKYIRDDVIRDRVIVYQSFGNGGGGVVMPKRRGTGGASNAPHGVNVSMGTDATFNGTGDGVTTISTSPKTALRKTKGPHAFVEINNAEIKNVRGGKKPDLYLFHIRDNCQKIIERVARWDLAYKDFAADEDKQLIMSKLLEQIGENVGKLGRLFRKSHPEIPWDQFIESRQHLAHVYEDVVMESVWATATEKIPVLLAEIEALIREVATPKTNQE
ncbi:MAG TPA: HepT-like ribonuclease domain-containing protein [Spirochaetia bacterium]|nr:HepT-like ribonuclease domain-containing protein [Spirochaetia bacterium]